MTQEGAKPDDPSLTRFSYFSLADSENCVFPLTRLQSRVSQQFGGKLALRKPNCTFLGGRKQHERPKHGSVFSITNPIYFSFIGMLHNCNQEK